MANDPDEQYLPHELPASITRTLYIRYGMGKYNSGKISIDEHNLQGESFAAVLLKEMEITIELPPQDREELTTKALAVLEEEKAAVMAENHQRLMAVQHKIDNLLAITYEPSVATEARVGDLE